ncbi:MYB [Ectocarpus sp. CCAP 1310/34]|nr:MYB [Ectocarpus sp. CCAP 1310/34]
MSRMGRCSDRSAHQQRGECSAASKSGQARSQQLKRCAETTTPEEAAEGRAKRHDSGEARRRRVSSEDGEYTTDDDSDEDERGGAAGEAATSTTAGGGMHSGDPPTRKKTSARPRRWQPEEDKKLTLAVKESGEKDWKSIALKVGSRNHVQCLQRWKKVLRPGLVKGQWDAEEDAALMKLATAPFKNWGVLSQSMSGRTSKQCRERWCHHLDPSINKGAYTEEEDKIIIETQAKLGNRWSQIAARLPGRTENSIKIRCKALQRKVLSGSPSSGGRSGSTSSPAGRAPKKSTGTSTTARQSRELSSSSSLSASESCSSFESGLDTMAEQPPLAPLAVPPRAPLLPEQHPPVHFSRGMHFKLGGGGDGVPLPPAGAPPCHGNSVFSGPGPAAPAPGYAMPRAGLEQGWFEPKQDAAHQFLLLQQQQQQQQPLGSGSAKVEGGLCALALDRQHHLLQQQKYVPQPEQLVDVIPASQPFPSAINIDGGGGGGRGGGGGMFANSSDLSPAVEGFLVQPQYQHAQKQTPLMHEYIPSAFPQEGEQQQHQQEGGVGLPLDGELMSHAVAAVAAAEDRYAGGVGDGGGAYGICLPEDLACDGGGQRGNGVGQGGDIKPIGGAIGGDEVVNENGPIKECCSFLDLASAASADDNIIGDVDSWRPV